ncbi:MAG: hypothetical protein ACK5MV_03895 [Aminipila sp.]
MKNINFDAGMVELAIQGDESRVLKFNPENVDFQNALFEMLDHADEKMKEFEIIAKDYDIKASAMEPIEAAKEKIKIQSRVDDFIKTEIDGVFGCGNSGMIFQEASPSAKSSSGQYVFMNFFEALLQIIQPEIKRRNESVQKIISDHKRKVKK